MKELTKIQADPNSAIHFSYFSKSAAETDFAIFLRASLGLLWSRASEAPLREENDLSRAETIDSPSHGH